MNHSMSSTQPHWLAWSCEQLEHKRVIALGFSLEPASIASYSSALQSYVTFCHLHDFPIEPTPDTLSFYVVYMRHHIKPTSVKSYLSSEERAICHRVKCTSASRPIRSNLTPTQTKNTNTRSIVCKGSFWGL